MFQTKYLLRTGLENCYDQKGKLLTCSGTGQDAELLIGRSLPNPRFEQDGGLVFDRYTDLIWPQIQVFDYPVRWLEGLQLIEDLNNENYLSRKDWRMPNRRELRSLIWHGAKKPALPPDHPFSGLKQTWYWTSTTSAMVPGYAWYIHLEGGRMFWGRKDQFYLLFPVCNRSRSIPKTGQKKCFDIKGNSIDCPRSGQDGEYQAGVAWPELRFVQLDLGIWDRLTNLIWYKDAGLASGGLTWKQALDYVQELNQSSSLIWHLPNINELESLVDASRSTPALSDQHLFINVGEVYWSSTSSVFDPGWAYALYMHKGAVGVGNKEAAGFGLWPVAVNNDFI